MAALTKQDVRQIIKEEVVPLIDAAQAKNDARFDRLEKRLAVNDDLTVGLDNRTKRLEEKVDCLEMKVDRLEVKVDNLEVKVDHLAEVVHRSGILSEEMNKKIDTMLEILESTVRKTEEIDPLKERMSGCEEQVSVLRLAVNNHVTDEKLHPIS